MCVSTPNLGNGPGTHTPAVPEGKKRIPAVLEVPTFEPLDTRMAPRLRRRYADQVEAILKSKLVAIDNHVLRNGGDSALSEAASTAIREHLAAVKAWAVGIRPKA